MTRASRLAYTIAAVAGALLLTGAGRPTALRATAGGLWEVSGAPGSAGPVRQCIADTAALAQFEHRARACTRVVISDEPSSTVIHYTCPGGGFGRSKLTLITPRSLRIETQGIAGDFPFNYVVQARRTGNC